MAKGGLMHLCNVWFNSLSNDKILDLSKLKAFADDKVNAANMTSYIFDRKENIVGKGEIAGDQHFFLYSTLFSKGFFPRVNKSTDYIVKSEWNS